MVHLRHFLQKCDLREGDKKFIFAKFCLGVGNLRVDLCIDKDESIFANNTAECICACICHLDFFFLLFKNSHAFSWSIELEYKFTSDDISGNYWNFFSSNINHIILLFQNSAWTYNLFHTLKKNSHKLKKIDRSPNLFYFFFLSPF